ncbi:MAG TPA: septal ring lytic transglycosylase RlpA family protein [Xanthobacteraceae bacterium]
MQVAKCRTVLVSLLAVAIGQILAAHHTPSRAGGQTGMASVYSTDSGSRTANGERLEPGALTAAHRTLPFGSKVKITNQSNGRSVIVTVNDRGPFVSGRVIDVTPAAARALGFSGLTKVTLDVAGKQTSLER